MNTLWWTRSLPYHSSMCALCRWRRLRLLCARIHFQNNSKCLLRQNWLGGTLVQFSRKKDVFIPNYMNVWLHLLCGRALGRILSWCTSPVVPLSEGFSKGSPSLSSNTKNLFTLINKISSLAMLVVVREEIKTKWRITGWESFEVSSLKRLFTIWLVAGFTTLVGI